jgi:8-oxo-dGTP pyrophosphatase MutT (NUDIX family)
VAGIEKSGVSGRRYAYLAEGNAKQARKRVAVDLLIRDARNRALLVNPSYKDYWDLPGGMSEANEPPVTTARRELSEELGVDIAVGRLLVLDWVGPHGPWDDQLIFIFDGGMLESADTINLEISDKELIDFSFVSLDDSEKLLRSDMWRLLRDAYEALENGTTRYLETRRT